MSEFEIENGRIRALPNLKERKRVRFAPTVLKKNLPPPDPNRESHIRLFSSKIVNIVLPSAAGNSSTPYP